PIPPGKVALPGFYGRRKPPGAGGAGGAGGRAGGPGAPGAGGAGGVRSTFAEPTDRANSLETSPASGEGIAPSEPSLSRADQPLCPKRAVPRFVLPDFAARFGQLFTNGQCHGRIKRSSSKNQRCLNVQYGRTNRRVEIDHTKPAGGSRVRFQINQGA